MIHVTEPHSTQFGAVRAVMAFVDDPEQVATWWSGQLDVPPQSESGFWWLEIDGVEFGFHPADEIKNPHGSSTVAYWSVANLDRSRAAFIEAGCTPLRGPLQVETGRRICQLTDPFGIVFGLDGP